MHAGRFYVVWRACTQALLKAMNKPMDVPEPYLILLPSSPTGLLASAPATALKPFSRQCPPVSCPLSRAAIDHCMARINMRGGITSGNKGAGNAPEVAVMQGLPIHASVFLHAVSSAVRPLHSISYMCGYTYIYMYIHD